MLVQQASTLSGLETGDADNVVCSHYRSFKLMSLFPVTAILFTAGFSLRVYCSSNYGNIPTFIASQFLIYVSP